MTDDSSNMQSLYLKIKQQIINQDLKPGERLPERELAEKYNVSRTPIRQALQQLSIEGLVEFIPYKGAFIKDLTIEEFKDITQLRMVLEKLAVEICCDSSDESVVKDLEEIITKQKNAIINKDVKEYSLLDQEFHYSFVRTSENKELKKFIELLNQKSFLSRIRTLSLPGQMERSVEEHQEILNCILLKDKEGAGNKASAHVQDALQTYINIHNLMTQFK
ncbi:GntR family transcriptional regulator [Metabacillus herbersteinensis]|uniref:GntR family transcriptional regulator n=1 Tax=Metabacillus herbersteinensis TaxID=283816 RepID=A0ABV6GFR6_9BACI